MYTGFRIVILEKFKIILLAVAILFILSGCCCTGIDSNQSKLDSSPSPDSKKDKTNNLQPKQESKLQKIANLGKRQKELEEYQDLPDKEQKPDSASISSFFKKHHSYSYDISKRLQFHRWIRSTINWSKKTNSYAIVVNKSIYTLFLLKNGKIYSKYPIELGFNPVDDKYMQGDGCTPEGKYKISRKKDIGETSFYKALLINYPNTKDKKQFARLKDQNIIPAQAEIGGLIEIHGHGSGNQGNGSGANWTDGCIAMSNKDLDKIFPLLEEGAYVTIVK